MLRWIVVALTMLLALFWYCVSQATFFHHGGLPASTPLSIAALNLSNTSFTGGSPSGTTVGQLSVLMSFGPFLGSYSIRTTGTDHNGTACTTAGNNFTPSGGSLVTVGVVAVGSYAGVCVVATQGSTANSPFIQAFTITANGPGMISFNPTSLTFSSTAGNPSAAQTTTAKNTGGQTFTISSISITGANPGDFSISSNTCGGTLAVNATCVIGVIFNSPTAGTFNASLSMTGS